MVNQFFWTYIVIIELYPSISCLQFFVGDCPIYYEEPCRPDLVKFILSSTAQNGSSYRELNPFKLQLPPNFSPSVPLKILIHGYGGLKIDRAIKSILKSYQSLGYNVIIVDWGFLAQVPCYPTSFFNTWHVGQCIAVLAVSLMPYGVDPNNLHLVGFSLGAHIAGFAGKNLKKVLKAPPGRITGLDPALPFFVTMKNEWKLDSSDAKFVDVVHTSAGTFGKIEATGHVDFYLNGGVLQPACYNAPHPSLCSHVMAGLYFAESIKNRYGFIGVQCDNIAYYILGFCANRAKSLMGEYVNQWSRGSFYVSTVNSTNHSLNAITYVYV